MIEASINNYLLEETQTSFARAEECVLKSMNSWFDKFSDQLNPSAHFLRMGPVDICRSKETTVYERVAHLMLRPRENKGKSKVLIYGVLAVKVRWPNG